MESSQLIAANRPDLSVARWHIRRHIDELILEIFLETPVDTVDSGLLEAIVLSVVLLRSGRPLGDSLERINLSDPVYLAALFSNRGLTHIR